MTEIPNAKKWRYAVIPTLFVVFLALYPQLNFWMAKGSDWQGAYYVCNFDEVAYSAYINALIEGKPRKYDPYLGAEADHESLYSIQFIPAYTITLPARLFRLETSTVFIALNALFAAFAALFIFWFLFEITGDGPLSAAGVLIVCCLGTAVAFEGELRSWVQGNILVDYLPFLRRYQPGFAFPIFFLFCGAVWRSLMAEERRTAVIYSLASAMLFAVLVFSYFFLWTAAAAWLACIYILFLVWRRGSLTNLLTNASIVAVVAVAALIPYFIMLSGRSPHVDSVQLLTNTHSPDLASSSALLGLVITLIIAVLSWRGSIDISARRTLFAIAFAVTPFVLVNQQVITGRSLQPVHYEIFISNYMVLISLVLFLSLVFEPKRGVRSMRRAIVYMAVAACAWGLIEATGSTKRNSAFADLRDLSVPAIRFIEIQEHQRPPRSIPAVVLATNTGTSDFIPTEATLRPLWSSHTTSGGSLDIAENKRLFYLYLYYSGFTEADVAFALREKSFEVTAAIFGSERALPELGLRAEPVTPAEIDTEVRLFADFINNFTRTSAANPELSYVIVPDGAEHDWSKFDKWYLRDNGTVAGKLKVYGVKLRP